MSVNRPAAATTSLILLFALIVALEIAGAVWETLAWRAIYQALPDGLLRRTDPTSSAAAGSATSGAARTVAELGIHRDDAETILRKLGEIEALQRQPGSGEP